MTGCGKHDQVIREISSIMVRFAIINHMISLNINSTIIISTINHRIQPLNSRATERIEKTLFLLASSKIPSLLGEITINLGKSP